MSTPASLSAIVTIAGARYLLTSTVLAGQHHVLTITAAVTHGDGGFHEELTYRALCRRAHSAGVRPAAVIAAMDVALRAAQRLQELRAAALPSALEGGAR